MAQGFHSTGDLLTKTADGRDLNGLWTEYQELISAYNGERASLINFLTYEVNEPVVSIPTIGGNSDFEEASEYGEPKGVRPVVGMIDRGFTFKWYDLAARFTWQYLSEATEAQINAVTNSVLEASSRLEFKRVFHQLFRNTNQTFTLSGVQGGSSFTAFPFYNGDAEVPPTYRTTTFAAGHDHFNTLAGATVTTAALEALMADVTEHGYTRANGYRLVVLVNQAQGATIRTFKSVANGGTGTWDFIPSTGNPAILLPQNQLLLGSQASDSLDGLNRIGTYGDWNIVENEWMPAGYLFAFATGGAENLTNPIGIRRHRNPDLRGLRLVKGKTQDYPLIDSFYVNGLGTGIRQRGAGAVLQLGNAGAYAPPADYAA
jgi:hypothetical protein